MGDFIEDSNLKKKKMKQEKGKEIKVLTRPCKTEISSRINNSVLHSDKDKGFRRSVITPIMPESEFCSRSTRQHNNKCKEEISYHDVLNLSKKPEIELNNNKMINEGGDIGKRKNKMIEIETEKELNVLDVQSGGKRKIKNKKKLIQVETGNKSNACMGVLLQGSKESNTIGKREKKKNSEIEEENKHSQVSSYSQHMCEDKTKIGTQPVSMINSDSGVVMDAIVGDGKRKKKRHKCPVTSEVKTDNFEKGKLHVSSLNGHYTVSLSSPVVPCVHDTVKQRIYDNQEKGKMHIGQQVNGKVSSIPVSDGVGCSVAANYSSLEDMLSRYAYKGGTEVKRRRNDVKKTQEMQNCHPYSREAVLGEKWEDKEKKVLDSISLVKKKAQTIDCNEAHEDKSNVYEAKSSYFTLENLKCNARKENGTEAEKVLQKKKRKVEKLHKKTCAEVQVVSPYFKNSVGEVDRKERKFRIIRTPRPCGQKSSVEAKISPYFQNVKKDEGNVVSCLVEGGTESSLQMKKTKLVKTAKTKLQLSAAQKLDEAYQRRSPVNSWKPPRSHFNLIQEEVHEDKSNVYEAKSSSFTRENLKCNARKENGTEAEKVLQKRKRKVEKLNKKTCAEVHVVSPYFKNSVGEVDRKERKFWIIRTPRPCGQKSSVEAKISPYFQNVKKDEGNVVSCLVEGSTESSLQMKKTKQVKTAKTKLQLSAAQKLNEAYQRRSPENSWKPPRSHFNLIQEDHAHDPWRVLVICMLLNRTSGGQVKRIILDLFQLCSNAKVATEVAAEQIEKVIQSLGLQKKRAVMIQRLSSEYLKEDWTYVTQLHGVGKYAADGYAIFCTGKWDRVTPDDHMLHRYWDFLHSNNVTSQ